MILSQTHVSFPVLEIRSVVHHSTPRRPTAFERVILRLCRRFGSESAYNSISLERIFVDILGVAEPDAMVLPTVNELLDLDVLRFKRDTSTLDRLSIGDFEITDRGKEMLANDILPARPQENEVEHCYDPIRQRLLNAAEERTIRDQVGDLAIDAFTFTEIYPGELILNEIQKSNPNWLQSNSRIERLEKIETLIRWVSSIGTIELTDEGIRVSFPDDSLTNYVNEMPTDEIFARILRPALVEPWLEVINFEGLPRIGGTDSIQDVTAEMMPLENALAGCPDEQKVWFVGMASLVEIPEMAPEGHCFVVFQSVEGSGRFSVSWNNEHNGAIVRVDSPFSIDNCMLATQNEMFLLQRLRVELGQREHDIPLGFWSKSLNSRLPLDTNLLELSRSLINAGGQEESLVPAFWNTPEVFWQILREKLEAESKSPIIALKSLLECRERYLRLKDLKTIPGWDDQVLHLLAATFGSLEGEMDEEQAATLAALLVNCGISSTTKISEALQLFILHCLPPTSLQSFCRIVSILKNAGDNWEIPYPSRLYSQSVLRGIAENFGQPIILEAFANGNEFESATCELQRIECSLAISVGLRSFAKWQRESFQTLLREADTATCFELLDLWEKQFAAYQQAYPEIFKHSAESAFDNVSRQVTGLGVVLRKLTSEIDPRFNEVVVIDTSVLIEDPSILKHFQNDQLAVVSKRVIEELDDNKENEALRPRISEATRLLNAFASDRIHFCEADLALLPPDYRHKGDNLILSVALKYRRYKPILLTNDNNLALKAKAENITAIRLKDFIHRKRNGLHEKAVKAVQTTKIRKGNQGNHE